MANFLDEIGKTIFGQQDLPEYEQVSSADLLGRAQGLLPQIGAFNTAMAQQQVGLTPYENQIRALRYGQAINPLQEAYTSNILSNLNLGSSLPQDLQQEVIRGALQGSAASGFGLSPGGRALVGRDLGLSSYNIGQQRRGEAFNALQAFRPERIEGQLNAVSAIGLEQNNIDRANARRAEEAGMRNANRAAIISSLSSYAKLGGAVLGTAVGSAFGTTGWGSSLGGIMGAAGGAMDGAGQAGAAGAGTYGSNAYIPDNYGSTPMGRP